MNKKYFIDEKRKLHKRVTLIYNHIFNIRAVTRTKTTKMATRPFCCNLDFIVYKSEEIKTKTIQNPRVKKEKKKIFPPSFVEGRPETHEK